MIWQGIFYHGLKLLLFSVSVLSLQLCSMASKFMPTLSNLNFSHLSVGNSLIMTCAKSRSVEDVHNVSQKMPNEDVISWIALIVAYAYHWYGKYSLQLFDQMQEANMKPDEFSFIVVLFACNQASLIDEGLHYFNSMN